jgi:hypothetical protein
VFNIWGVGHLAIPTKVISNVYNLLDYVFGNTSSRSPNLAF